jgi:NitT/TauT family transport system substrate-binding protein
MVFHPSIAARGTALILLVGLSHPVLAADKLRAGTPEPTAFVFAVLDVAIDGGFFKKHDLDVERLDFGGGAKMHQAMAAGSLDIIVGTGSDMLFLARGAPERGIGAYANDLASLSVVVRADDTVKTLADLKGKTIGTTTPGSFTSWIAMQVSNHQGWGPEGMKRAYLGAMSGIIAGLMAKNVDAIMGTTSSGYVMEKEGRARILMKASDLIKDYVADILYASGPLMAEHPDQVRRFLKAWYETIAFMKANKAEAIRLTQKDTHLPDDIASKIYDGEMPTFFTDGHIDKKKFAVVKQSLVDMGLIASMPDDKDLINESFLP